MAHKTDQRPYQPKRISAARARSLVLRYLKALDTGKAAYAEADEALDELLTGDLVGSEIKLTDGRTATIVDQFAAKTKVWKPCGVSRYKLEVSEAKE